MKARADYWVAAGELDKAKEIRDLRGKLLRELSVIENAVFAEQTNKKSKTLSAEELQEALSRAIAALDALIGKMDCESRWKSGACEILPLPENRSFRDLLY